MILFCVFVFLFLVAAIVYAVADYYAKEKSKKEAYLDEVIGHYKDGRELTRREYQKMCRELYESMDDMGLIEHSREMVALHKMQRGNGIFDDLVLLDEYVDFTLEDNPW